VSSPGTVILIPSYQRFQAEPDRQRQNFFRCVMPMYLTAVAPRAPRGVYNTALDRAVLSVPPPLGAPQLNRSRRAGRNHLDHAAVSTRFDNLERGGPAAFHQCVAPATRPGRPHAAAPHHRAPLHASLTGIGHRPVLLRATANNSGTRATPRHSPRRVALAAVPPAQDQPRGAGPWWKRPA